jgi:hypothetical protein
MDWNAVGDWIWMSLQNLSTVAPLGTLLAVLVAYFSYRGTIRQKTLADNRNAWWSRVQWAIDAALSDDEQRRATGMAAIEQMQDSELATEADQSLLVAMANAIVDETLEELEELETDEDARELVVENESIGDNKLSEGGRTDHD